jgi:hypothetical protein
VLPENEREFVRKVQVHSRVSPLMNKHRLTAI